jgi:hypothetical protein
MTTRIITCSFLAFFAAASACGSTQPPPVTPGPVTPVPIVIVSDGAAPQPESLEDAGRVVIVVDGTDPPDAPNGSYTLPKCASACSHLRALRCSDGTSRPGEDSCYVVCKRAEGSGKIDFHLDCVNTAKTIAAVRLCHSYRCL